jgi:hypothetical protein
MKNVWCSKINLSTSRISCGRIPRFRASVIGSSQNLHPTCFSDFVDAYVGASLYDFDVGEDLDGSARLQVRIPVR